MSKRHSRYVTVNYGSSDITDSVKSINGVGLQQTEVDVATLARSLDEFVQGRESLNIDVSGPFNSGDEEAHEAFDGMNGNQSGSTLRVQIGANATPTTGDPEFVCASILTTGYTVDIPDDGAVSYAATLRPGVGATASWASVA